MCIHRFGGRRLKKAGEKLSWRAESRYKILERCDRNISIFAKAKVHVMPYTMKVSCKNKRYAVGMILVTPKKF